MAEKDGIRARYITANEKAMLVTLIEERNDILFNKSHDFRIIHRKKAAWEEVTSLFNAAGYGPPRSQQQLKKFWENAKGKAKKQHAAYKQETMRTGGGTPKPEDEETAKILTIISDDLDGEENELNCDALQSTGQPHTVIGIRNDRQKCEIMFDASLALTERYFHQQIKIWINYTEFTFIHNFTWFPYHHTPYSSNKYFHGPPSSSPRPLPSLLTTKLFYT
ncbi:myb/SANT-like DNA-binding domain-containing protein 3 [Palaemon carinicauda]|uniref:myb/SANT-like DNA-binding domain-containing protein 3 n=1 Tax=Palaemon carinicauda TaxID=392227 RepID=UPI0035B68264